MASLINIQRKDGVLRAIQFVAPNGGRPMLRLGRVPLKTAQAVQSHVEHLLNAAIQSQPAPRDTAAWVASLSDKAHAKLASAGLVRPRAAKLATEIGPFFDRYIKGRTDLKPRTILNLKQVRGKIVEHFGAARDMQTINRGEVNDWHRGLKAKLAPATVAMHVKKARQVFADAVDRKLIAENPVRGLKAGSMENKERFVYVTPETINKVINACPDDEWALIFALARYGGLRVPSEIRALRWVDVDLAAGRLTVRASKTAHHKDKGVRVVPIFPEIDTFLRVAHFNATGPHVVERHRGDNLGTMAEKIIGRAGVEVWEKLFQNLRSSCETDWTARFPLHVACAWAGNTEAVAKKHYLQVTADHFAEATGKSAAKSAAEGDGNGRKEPAPQSQKPALSAGFGGTEYPQGESNLSVFRRGIEGVKGRTLRNALRRLRNGSPGQYAAALTRFRRRPAPAPAKDGAR